MANIWHEPTADARQLAAHNRQIYLAHVQAGFTPAQAMQVIEAMITGAILMNGEDDGKNS